MAKRPTLDINYAYQNAISYSQYSMYTSCQHRWYLAYVKKHKIYTPGINMVFGTAMHEVLQEYLTVMFTESTVKANAIDLHRLLKDRLAINYKEEVEQNDGIHYSTPEDLTEFYLDGVAILDWFKKHRAKFFSKKNTELIGVEVPILVIVSDKNPNVFLQGFIDIVLYNTITKTYTIYDIKTSTRGWSDKEKKDTTKIDQILFYKKYFSKVMQVPEEEIEVRFFILRRKIYEQSEFPMNRVSEFVPAQKTKKVKEAANRLESFIENSFNDKAKHIDKVYTKNTDNCKWCQFKDKPDLCDKKVL